MTRELYRIAVVGTNGKQRRYISSTDDNLIFSDRAGALHWNKREAEALAGALMTELARIGRRETLQIEKA